VKDNPGNKMKSVCIVPDLRSSVGGPGTFQRKLSDGLAVRNIRVTYDPRETFDALLVINGTRNLHLLQGCKSRGVRIVQRLGAPDIRDKPWVSLLGYWQALKANLVMRIIRGYFANHVVYQSRFVEEWWIQSSGRPLCTSSIIHNGVDLTEFSPEGMQYMPERKVCILSVEGTQTPDARRLSLRVARSFQDKGMSTELLMFGKFLGYSQTRRVHTEELVVSPMGVVENSKLPFYYRGASFYLFTDYVSPGCPNSVIEALACGTPVLGFSHNVLHEMITDRAGLLVQRGGDDDIERLCRSGIEIVDDLPAYRSGARKLGEERYGLESMVDHYMETLFP
jgi:glycosyltransferase involved in cell wall biosynthesis